MTVTVRVSPDPRIWVRVPMAWPTAEHPTAEAWARQVGPAVVADQGIDDNALGERLAIVLTAVAALTHPPHVQARYLHLPDVRGGFMLLEISAVETHRAVNRHVVHRLLTEADRRPAVGAVQVQDVALPDGRPVLRVLRFERAEEGGPLTGVLRHALRLPAVPELPGAVDVTTTITGTDLDALLRSLPDVESLLEDVAWAGAAPVTDAVPTNDDHRITGTTRETAWTTA
jgi:hypothetical protein